MAKKAPSTKSKPRTKTLREGDIVAAPKPRAPGPPPVRTGIRAGAKNSNHGEGFLPTV